MKLSVIARTAHRTIMEHTTSATLGMAAGVQGVWVEDPKEEVATELPVVNTCVGARNLLGNPELMKDFGDAYGLVSGTPVSYLYLVLSPTSNSDVMELQISSRFMTGNVGAEIGFVQGTGLSCGPEVYEAFPNLEELIDALHVIQYCGELLLGVTRDFQICRMAVGHCTGAWSLFTELAQQSPQDTLEFCFGKRKKCLLHEDRVAVSTLLSYPPYPYTDRSSFSVLAPCIAERHLYRFNVGACELAFVAAGGGSVAEARRRVRRTIRNCEKYNPEIQYRVDYGKFCKFLFNEEKYRSID
ncbi:hypothetical protein N9878_00385 [bacterium]|nr:hypothetical protein [bacterium]